MPIQLGDSLYRILTSRVNKKSGDIRYLIDSSKNDEGERSVMTESIKIVKRELKPKKRNIPELAKLRKYRILTPSELDRLAERDVPNKDALAELYALHAKAYKNIIKAVAKRSDKLKKTLQKYDNDVSKFLKTNAAKQIVERVILARRKTGRGDIEKTIEEARGLKSSYRREDSDFRLKTIDKVYLLSKQLKSALMNDITDSISSVVNDAKVYVIPTKKLERLSKEYSKILGESYASEASKALEEIVDVVNRFNKEIASLAKHGGITKARLAKIRKKYSNEITKKTDKLSRAIKKAHGAVKDRADDEYAKFGDDLAEIENKKKPAHGSDEAAGASTEEDEELMQFWGRKKGKMKFGSGGEEESGPRAKKILTPREIKLIAEGIKSARKKLRYFDTLYVNEYTKHSAKIARQVNKLINAYNDALDRFERLKTELRVTKDKNKRALIKREMKALRSKVDQVISSLEEISSRWKKKGRGVYTSRYSYLGDKKSRRVDL